MLPHYTKYCIYCHVMFYIIAVTLFCDIFYEKVYKYCHPLLLLVYANAND
jgi:hypothetical protein